MNLNVDCENQFGRNGKTYLQLNERTRRNIKQKLGPVISDTIERIKEKYISPNANDNFANDAIADIMLTSSSNETKTADLETLTIKLLTTYEEQTRNKDIPPYAAYVSLSTLTTIYTHNQVNTFYEKMETVFRVSRFNWRQARLHALIHGPGGWTLVSMSTDIQAFNNT
jgi:hypothetical protein